VRGARASGESPSRSAASCPAVPADKIRQRIDDLDSDEFKRREAASAELAALGD
jgi:hypothetical protein